MKRTLILGSLSLVAFAACTTTGEDRPDSTTAGRSFRAADRALQTALGALDAHARIAPVTGNVNLTSPCSSAGSIGISGTYDNTDAGTSFDLIAAFSGCHEAEGTLDGSLHWTSVTTAAGHEDDHWSGNLDFSDQYGSWSCPYAVHMVSVDGATTEYTGTICGYDVSGIGD
jgi:hypothetical protein